MAATEAFDLLTDLGERGDTLWDFFDPNRSTLHSEAVASAASWASQPPLGEQGQSEQEQCGGPQEDHGSFRAGAETDLKKREEEKSFVGRGEEIVQVTQYTFKFKKVMV